MDTSGFNDRSWLDARGTPHTEEMRVEERFSRRDYGHMDLKITITDPKTFTRPIAFSVVLDLMPDTDLLEHYCAENERDDAHIRGGARSLATRRYALAQSGELMTATASYGGPAFPGVAAPVREDGTSAFTPQMSITDSGVTLTLDAAFNINSLRVGELTGTVNEVWRVPNVTGEGRLVQDIVATTRTSTTTLNGRSDGVSRFRILRKLAQDR